MFSSKTLVFGVAHICLCFLLIKETQAVCDVTTAANERLAQSVELKFYQTQTDTWLSNDYSAKVSAQVSNEATSYCAANPDACGVSSCCTTAFKDLNVGVESGYPKKERKDISLKIYLDLPDDLTTTGTLQCVVTKTTLQTIVGNVRQKIKDDTGIWITYVNTEFYGIPPDSELNAIIIPIACVVLLAVILTAVILHFWNKRREEVANRMKKIENRKKSKTSKVSPTYDISREKVDPDSKKLVPEEKPKRKDQLYKDRSMRSMHNSGATKNASIHSEDSAIKLDSEPPRSRTNFSYQGDSSSATYEREMDVRPAGHLPALSTEELAESGDHHEKKKKKKSKKHRKNKDSDSYGAARNHTTEYYMDYLPQDAQN